MFKKRIQSFFYAFQGLKFLIQSQFHAKIHLIFTIAVIVSGLFFQITKSEWIVLLICIASVWSLEAVNTAIEQMVDLVTSEYHEKAKNAKDVAAAAVLIFSIFSAIIGFLIFLPYLFQEFF